MSPLDWQSDGLPAILGLVLYSAILLAFVLRSVRGIRPISRLLHAALAWHFVIWAVIAFWLLPHYAASGQVDAVGYHSDGMRVAEWIRSGAWENIRWGLGTDVMPIITGILYTPLGGDVYGITFFSAALGLCGSLYFCRAFSLWATPEQIGRYGLIVLFLPSFAMWTSTFGKDSWVCLGLGLASYGYSLMLRARTFTGLPHFLIGFVITAAIRPHIALVLVALMALAFMWGLTQRRRGSLLTKAFLIVVLAAMSAGLVKLASSFTGVSDLSAGSVEAYAETRSAANTGVGNSDVEVQAAPGIVGALRAFPRGIVRVLFQPFPWDINGINSALAAAENLFLLWYVLNNAKRLRGLLRGLAREPFLLFSSSISLLLLLMLSLTANLGLISRQRAQLLPFLFAVLVAARRGRARRAEAVTTLHQAYAPSRVQVLTTPHAASSVHNR